jgi:hypothetical protein
MTKLFSLPRAVKRDPAIAAWRQAHADALGQLAQHWFSVMRGCGDDVRETLHDGYPTACIGDAAFAYVGVFRAHVNVGFFRGADLADPAGLLQGTGKLMRHVKLKPGKEIDAAALESLIAAAYENIKIQIRP